MENVDMKKIMILSGLIIVLSIGIYFTYNHLNNGKVDVPTETIVMEETTNKESDEVVEETDASIDGVAGIDNSKSGQATETLNEAEQNAIIVDYNKILSYGLTLEEAKIAINYQENDMLKQGYDREFIDSELNKIAISFGTTMDELYKVIIEGQEQIQVEQPTTVTNTLNTGSTGGNTGSNTGSTGSTGGNTQTTPNTNDKNGNGINDAFEEFGDGSVGGGKTTSDDDFQLGMPGDNQTSPYPKTEWDKNGNGLDDQLEEYGDGSVGGGKTTSDDNFQLGMPGDN